MNMIDGEADLSRYFDYLLFAERCVVFSPGFQQVVEGIALAQFNYEDNVVFTGKEIFAADDVGMG